MYACYIGFEKHAKILIDGGANIDFKYDEGGTPFIAAVLAVVPGKYVIRVCNVLKDAGAKMNLHRTVVEHLIRFSRNSRSYRKVLKFIKNNATISTKLKYYFYKLTVDVNNFA